MYCSQYDTQLLYLDTISNKQCKVFESTSRYWFRWHKQHDLGLDENHMFLKQHRPLHAIQTSNTMELHKSRCFTICAQTHLSPMPDEQIISSSNIHYNVSTNWTRMSVGLSVSSRWDPSLDLGTDLPTAGSDATPTDAVSSPWFVAFNTVDGWLAALRRGRLIMSISCW